MQHFNFREETLRINFAAFFRVVFLSTLLLAVSYLWFVVGVRDLTFFFVDLPIAVAVLAAISVLVLRRRFTVSLEPDRLICCDFWCRYEPVTWSSIKDARVWRLLGLDYLRVISSDTKHPLWIPLDVERRAHLRGLVEDYTEPGNPLRETLARV